MIFTIEISPSSPITKTWPTKPSTVCMARALVKSRSLVELMMHLPSLVFQSLKILSSCRVHSQNSLAFKICGAGHLTRQCDTRGPTWDSPEIEGTSKTLGWIFMRRRPILSSEGKVSWEQRAILPEVSSARISKFFFDSPKLIGVFRLFAFSRSLVEIDPLGNL